MKKDVSSLARFCDALIRAEKKIAIVAVKGSSIDRIFRKRNIQYFSEPDDLNVTRRTIEMIKSGNYDFIVVYHCEYDGIQRA